MPDPTPFTQSPKVDLKSRSGVSKVDSELTALEKEADLCEEIEGAHKASRDHLSEWIKTAKEDIKFYAGEQWDDQDKAKLESEGRPAMSFNVIRPIIKLISGHMLQNSARINVAPEGGEDEVFSQVMDFLIDHVDKTSDMDFNLGYLFVGGEAIGRAWLEFYLDFTEDPIFGRMRTIYHGKPNVIFPDPQGVAYDLSDRRYIVKVVRKTKEQLKSIYPEKASLIDDLAPENDEKEGDLGYEGDRNNYGADKTKSQIGINRTQGLLTEPASKRPYVVKEYWYKKFAEKTFVYFFERGDCPMFDSKDEADAEINRRAALWISEGNDPAKFKVLVKKRKIQEMWVAVKAGGRILENGLSPFEPRYHGFPFFPFIADWTPEADKEVYAIQGLVRRMKDCQKEKNKSRSQFLHIINTSANSGWVGDDDALSDDKKAEVKNFGSVPGITIWKKPGSYLERIQPISAPTAQALREKAATDGMKEVTGINADLLAIDQSANPSGKAISLRIRQALTILEPDFRNFRYTKRMIGEFLFKIVPVLFDVAKVKKVIGQKFIQQNKLDDQKLAAFLIMVEDGKYDVSIAEQGNTRTLREETFNDLMTMMEKGVQIPFDVILDFMNIPNKEDVIEKIKQHQAQQAQAVLAMQAAKHGGAPQPLPPGPGQTQPQVA